MPDPIGFEFLEIWVCNYWMMIIFGLYKFHFVFNNSEESL